MGISGTELQELFLTHLKDMCGPSPISVLESFWEDVPFVVCLWHDCSSCEDVFGSTVGLGCDDKTLFRAFSLLLVKGLAICRNLTVGVSSSLHSSLHRAQHMGI